MAGEPILLAPGEGEDVTARPERSVRILADRPELALTRSRYAPGQRGPDRHVHREHADCFLVLDGELTFEVGSERVEGPAGSFVLVPPNVVHTFRNEGSADARFLNFHAPDAGFAEYLRGKRATFDSFDPPDDGGRPTSDALVRAPGEGEALALGPSSGLIRAGGDDGIGSLTVIETTVAPGFPGPPAHRHARMVDSFLVLEGTLTLRLGDDTVEAPAGSYALVPPGAVHSFSNPGDAPVRLLNVMAPGGLERYLVELAAETAGGPPDPARMAELAARYDFEPA